MKLLTHVLDICFWYESHHMWSMEAQSAWFNCNAALYRALCFVTNDPCLWGTTYFTHSELYSVLSSETRVCRRRGPETDADPTDPPWSSPQLATSGCGRPVPRHTVVLRLPRPRGPSLHELARLWCHGKCFSLWWWLLGLLTHLP